MNVFDFYKVIAFCVTKMADEHEEELFNAGLYEADYRPALEMLPKVFQAYFIPQKPVENRDEVLLQFQRLLGAVEVAIAGLSKEYDISELGQGVVGKLNEIRTEAAKTLEPLTPKAEK
jgi:hypothetical protein